ncbi:MAG: alpha/beta hydrolase-fold protein [Chitinophagaceae bacterium]
MKKNIYLILFFLFAQTILKAQFNVRIVVNESATKSGDDIYIAGNFNGWNPKDILYKLKPFGGNRKGIVLKDMPSGNIAFKFTRGSFDKVECTSDGRDIADRVLEVNGDLNVEFNVAGWKDDYPDKPKPYTASMQVRIIDTAFTIPQLQRKRRVWVYLPKGYGTATKTYPVIYMHDGQNLFNEQTAAYGEWGVDECLDSLQRLTQKECIIVGVDHGADKRLTEYNPYDNDKFGKGEGKEYASFLAKTLKPYIDSKYRTKKGRENTYVAGSSMGGLISLYTLFKYPDVFGGAGVFSPSFWIAPEIYKEAENFASLNGPKIYFYAGGKESTEMVADVDKMVNILQKKDRFYIRRSINNLAQHHEKAWRSEFPELYKWLIE